ncbi:MAG: IS1182 family transposase [Candidatus Tectomicrobia bacterium]|nr:IS1182 family transposase [Candidatus Tectomicrobia bacterium]
MIRNPSADAKTSGRFAEPLRTAHSERWRQLDAQLPHDHLAREIRDAMTHLDLAPLYQTYSGRGKAPHRPDLMLAIVLFELRRGQRHPSQWYQETHEKYPLWWLGFGICPSRSCWYEFRDRVSSYVDTLNTNLLHQAVEEELTTAQRGALDGSAVAANASRRRLINQERLQQRVQQLDAVAQDEAQGEAAEAVPGWMANTPRGRTRQHERYGQAQEQLVQWHRANEQRPPSQRREPDKIVISTGDPQAPLGLDKDGVLRPLYTGQTGRDVATPLILADDVFAQASDAAPLPLMLRRSHQLTGRRLRELLVDCGYVTGMDLAECAEQGVTLYGPWKANDWSEPKTRSQLSKDQFTWHRDLDAYECPAGHLLKRVGTHTRVCSGGREVVEWQYRGDAQTCQACPLREPCTTSKKSGRSVQRSEHEELIEAHRTWMETAEAKAVYRLRGQTIEIVFADVKEHRGLRRFSGHGLARVRTEFALEVLLHNLLVVHRSLSQRANVEAINCPAEDIAA